MEPQNDAENAEGEARRLMGFVGVMFWRIESLRRQGTKADVSGVAALCGAKTDGDRGSARYLTSGLRLLTLAYSSMTLTV